MILAVHGAVLLADVFCAVFRAAVDAFEHTDTQYLKLNDNASRDDG